MATLSILFLQSSTVKKDAAHAALKNLIPHTKDNANSSFCAEKDRLVYEGVKLSESDTLRILKEYFGTDKVKLTSHIYNDELFADTFKAEIS